MIVRPTARLVALDPALRVLLFQCKDEVLSTPDDPNVFWVTPGGGVEQGETFERAALRELWEETGIRATSCVGPCVLESDLVGRHSDFGDQEIIYRDRHFVVHLSLDEIVHLNPGAVTRASYLAHRWWTLDELNSTSESIWPKELSGIVRQVVAASRHA